jgi:hypothetical protein
LVAQVGANAATAALSSAIRLAGSVVAVNAAQATATTGIRLAASAVAIVTTTATSGAIPAALVGVVAGQSTTAALSASIRLVAAASGVASVCWCSRRPPSLLAADRWHWYGDGFAAGSGSAHGNGRGSDERAGGAQCVDSSGATSGGLGTATAALTAGHCALVDRFRCHGSNRSRNNEHSTGGAATGIASATGTLAGLAAALNTTAAGLSTGSAKLSTGIPLASGERRRRAHDGRS